MSPRYSFEVLHVLTFLHGVKAELGMFFGGLESFEDFFQVSPREEYSNPIGLIREMEHDVA